MFIAEPIHAAGQGLATRCHGGLFPDVIGLGDAGKHRTHLTLVTVNDPHVAVGPSVILAGDVASDPEKKSAQTAVVFQAIEFLKTARVGLLDKIVNRIDIQAPEVEVSAQPRLSSADDTGQGIRIT